MIPRPFTCCCAVLAIASGFFLYTKKHQTTLLDQQISKIVADTQRVRSQTAMLRTEWALENQPERLTRLAEQHLTGLHPMEPSQFVRMADLDKHLPAVSHDTIEAARTAAIAAVALTTPAVAPRAVQPAATVADVRPVRSQPQQDITHATTLVADATPARPKQPIRAVIRHDTAVADLRDADETLPAPRPQTPTRRPVQLAADTTRLAPAATRPAPVAVASAAPAAPLVATPRRVTPTAPITRVAAYTPRPSVADTEAEQPVRHPLPVTVASWHANRARHAAQPSTGYVEARANSAYGGSSLFGHGESALPPPVPMTN